MFVRHYHPNTGNPSLVESTLAIHTSIGFWSGMIDKLDRPMSRRILKAPDPRGREASLFLSN